MSMACVSREVDRLSAAERSEAMNEDQIEHPAMKMHRLAVAKQVAHNRLAEAKKAASDAADEFSAAEAEWDDAVKREATRTNDIPACTPPPPPWPLPSTPPPPPWPLPSTPPPPPWLPIWTCSQKDTR